MSEVGAVDHAISVTVHGTCAWQCGIVVLSMQRMAFFRADVRHPRHNCKNVILAPAPSTLMTINCQVVQH